MRVFPYNSSKYRHFWFRRRRLTELLKVREKEKNLRFRIESDSAAHTITCGEVLAAALEAKDVVVLEGNLGGGKTTFARGVLRGLGYRGRVQSPTFTLLRQYKLKGLTVYHLDLYRLKSNDIGDVGLDDFLSADRTVTLIEWGDKLRPELPQYIKIEFLFAGENDRTLNFSIKGYSGEKIKAIKQTYRL